MSERALLVAVLLVVVLPMAAGAADVKALLRDADEFRLPAASMEVETEVRLFRAGNLEKERRYSVYVKPGRRSLVVMRSPAEKGQKVLMRGDDFWLIMPATQRPVRITPMQKLLGDASTGDVATMSWSEDYGGAVTGEADVGGVRCLVLDLVAERAGVTYARQRLYLASADHRPVKAELFVVSDKQAKEATFEVERGEGRFQVSSMRLVDLLQAGRETVVVYLSRTPRSIPDEAYNPMFLTRGDFTVR
jgi:outer membrane lipoprotein-sorting protein